MKKRLLPLFCALAVLLALALPRQSAQAATNTVYLLAVNDKICDLPGGVLPLASGGDIYVPYTVFDKDSTGIDLGVYYGLIQDHGTILTLYSLSGSLAFNIYGVSCTDNQGNTMESHAILRSGIPYVPAAMVCSFFGLQYSFLTTADRGTLIRISNATATIGDSQFLSQATLAMTTRYNNIVKSQSPEPSPTAAPTPVPTAVPTPNPGRPSKEGVTVYLAVDASRAETDLTALFPAGVRVLFLFTPDSLTARASQVRKAVAQGHSIGLLVEGADPETALSQLEQGNELLSHIARIRTHIACADDPLTGPLTADGWRCWRSDVGGSTAASILSTLDARRTSGRVALPTSPSAISRVLTGLTADGYTLRQPLETDL